MIRLLFASNTNSSTPAKKRSGKIGLRPEQDEFADRGGTQQAVKKVDLAAAAALRAHINF